MILVQCLCKTFSVEFVNVVELLSFDQKCTKSAFYKHGFVRAESTIYLQNEMMISAITSRYSIQMRLLHLLVFLHDTL